MNVNGEPSPSTESTVLGQRSSETRLRPLTYHLFFVLALTAIVLAAAPASAQEKSTDATTYPFAHTFGLSLGGYFQYFNSSAGYSTADDAGGDVDLEDDTGLPRNRSSARLEGYWRMTRHQRLDFGYYYWDRKASATMTRDITWNDVVYQANARLDTTFNVQFIKLAYKYSFVQNDSVELAGSFGISGFRANVTLEGQAQAIGPDGQPAGDVSFTTKKTSKLLPVPVLGLHLDYAFTRTLIARGGVEYFQYRADNYDFKLVDARASLDWFFSDHWGLGAGYNYVGFDAGATGARVNKLRLKYTYDGAIAYLGMRY